MFNAKIDIANVIEPEVHSNEKGPEEELSRLPGEGIFVGKTDEGRAVVLVAGAEVRRFRFEMADDAVQPALGLGSLVRC